jgi:fructokinase
MKVICLGEVLIDFKETGDELQFQGYVGGSPLNVAVASSRLGVASGIASQASNDVFGQHIRAHLQENRVNTSLLLESDAPSTLAFVSEIAGEAHFSFLAEGAADTLYNPRPRPKLPAETAFLEFGSLGVLREPAVSAITDIVAMHERCTAVFDPNVRPALIPNREEYLESLRGWLALARLVKVSAQDLRWLHPEVAPAEIARAWLELGPEAVVVTYGPAGASLFRCKQAELRVNAPKVSLVDTVGAGDTFTAALMAGLLEGGAGQKLADLPEARWREVLEFAVAAAALACTKAGAQPPSRQEVTSFMKGLPRG